MINFEALGISAEELEWQKLAACNGINPKAFDELYIKKPKQRPITDQICLSCPVIAECGIAGVVNKETGTWGGIYLDNGQPVEELNNHKTDEFKRQLAERINES